MQNIAEDWAFRRLLRRWLQQSLWISEVAHFFVKNLNHNLLFFNLQIAILHRNTWHLIFDTINKLIQFRW